MPYLVAYDLSSVVHLLQQLVQTPQRPDDASFKAVGLLAYLLEALAVAPVVGYFYESLLDAVQILLLT